MEWSFSGSANVQKRIEVQMKVIRSCNWNMCQEICWKILRLLETEK